MPTRRGRSSGSDPGSQRLLSDERNDAVPVDNIRVEAPYDLPAGYELETIADGSPLLVTIPRGGVKAGQIFKPAAASRLADIPLNRLGESRKPEQSERNKRPQGSNNNKHAPVGAWKDSQWDCCVLGCCHPSFCNSCICPLLAAGQVITRLQLTWCGTPASTVAQVAVAFQVLVLIVVAYCCTRVFLFLIVAYLDPNTDPDRTEFIDPSPMYFFFAALDDIVTYIYFAIVVIVIRNIRSHVRKKYAIPENESTFACCRGCEDLCCSMWCPCLVVAQMMRHTANYEEQNAICCNSTGIEEYQYEGSTNGSAVAGSIV